MHTKTDRLFAFAVLTGLLLTAPVVNANDDVHSTAPNDRPELVDMTGANGFVIQLPAVDSSALVEQLHALRSAEIAHKQNLSSSLDEKQFDAGDTLIALVMPGGLLYAGYKKAAYARARDNLQDVSETITAYTDDLAMLEARLQPVTVAQVISNARH